MIAMSAILDMEEQSSDILCILNWRILTAEAEDVMKWDRYPLKVPFFFFEYNIEWATLYCKPLQYNICLHFGDVRNKQ